MKMLKHCLKKIAAPGHLIGAAAAGTAALCGKLENDNAVAPLNAMSHIVWGEDAIDQDGFSVKYTLTGLALCGSAMADWATLYERLLGWSKGRGNPAKATGLAVVVATSAYVLDYVVVPPRFTPGLEKRLSLKSVVAVYVLLGMGLALLGTLRDTD